MSVPTAIRNGHRNGPHHVTQRGNRRERIFFEDGDYALYRDWPGQSCRRFGVEVWAYCQLPNHVHLILTPEDGEGLALALSRTHRLYAGFVNARAAGADVFLKAYGVSD